MKQVVRHLWGCPIVLFSTNKNDRFRWKPYYTLLCSNVSTTPLRLQCLAFSWTTLGGKHCQHPIAVMGVVDTFRKYFLCWLKSWLKVWHWNGPGLKIRVGKTGVEIFCNHSSLKILTKNSPSLMRTPSITYSGWKLQDTTNFLHASIKLWNNWKKL